jgi:hypothetical protein
MRKELCENATSVRSAQGGQRGHLGMVVPAAQHNALPGAQPWVDPQNPGALQLPANAAQELGTPFHNGKEACLIRTTLEEMGHPQPPTTTETNNNVAAAIANDSVKQK